MQRTMTFPRRWAATSVVIAAALAACGGSDGDSADSTTDADDAGALVIDAGAAGAGEASDAASAGDPVAEPVATSDDQSTGAASDGSAGAEPSTDEEQAIAFAQCMRDEGIDWPDPTTNADGSVDPLGGRSLQEVAGASPQTTQAAADVCSPLLDGASFLPGGGGGFDAETQDAFLEFAACLRGEGLEVTDPDFGAGGNPVAGLFGDEFDPNDPDNAAAIDACSDVFAGTAIGVGG